MKRSMILVLALVALFLAACSSEGGGASATQTASATAEEPEDTQAPAESGGESDPGNALPSFDLDGDSELAGRFPDTVGGQPLEVQSFRGDTFAEMGGSDPSFQAFLDSVGANMDDVSVALGGSATGESILSVGAFRVRGVSEDELERQFLAATEEAGDVTGLTETSIAGKDVWTADDPSGQTDASSYVYTKDDTVYFLTGAEEQVAEILAALP